MNVSLFVLPNARPLSIGGSIMPGWVAKFFASGTLTPVAVYADAELTTPLGTEVQADLDGHMPPIYLRTDMMMRVQIYDADGILQPDGDVDPLPFVETSGGGGGGGTYQIAHGAMNDDGTAANTWVGIASVTHDDTGKYTIHFIPDYFAGRPSVAGSVEPTEGPTTIQVWGVTATEMHVMLHELASAIDKPFDIIAVGTAGPPV